MKVQPQIPNFPPLKLHRITHEGGTVSPDKSLISHQKMLRPWGNDVPHCGRIRRCHSEADDKLQVSQLTFHPEIFLELFLVVTGNQID